MNRYLTDGVTIDVLTGRTVVVVSLQPRVALDAVVSRIDPEQVTAIIRANGREEIRARSGGRVIFLASRGSTGRGFTADVLVLADPVTEDRLTDLVPMLASGPGAELIR